MSGWRRGKDHVPAVGKGSDLVRKLLVLLLALTVGCGVAASVTISLKPAYAENVVKGY